MNQPVSQSLREHSTSTSTLPSGAALVTRLLDQLRGGSLALHYPNGASTLLGEGGLVASLQVLDWEVFDRILAKGSIGFAEDYMAGRWQTDHLAPLLTLLASNRAQLARAIHGDALRLLGHRLWHMLRANTRKGSRRNIEAHYDLGNAFYALWLDETMTYSSALFAAGELSLAEAQRAKYRRILARLGAQPGQRILEIGCGWGGFAEVAATEYACHVHGITLSPSQLEWARRRAEQGGFADRVTLELRDYRDVQGRFDHIVSIEMIEAVGERFWPSYFARLHDSLVPGGRAVVQAITIADELFGHYRRDVDFIQRYIFPGGMLLAPEVVARQARRAGLRIVGDLAFGLDYAHTLALWHTRFNEVAAQVKDQGFPEHFLRMWRFYLAYCEAGFRAGSTDVHQYEFAHAGG